MGLFTKGPKPEKQPQYYQSATNMRTLNYKVYYMSLPQKILYFLIGFGVGGAVGYLFYGGIGLDEFGNPTMTTYVLNTFFVGVTGLIAGIKFLPIRVSQIIQKRKRKLNSQFRDMLEALNTSLGAGKNVPDSFKAVHGDLKVQYEEDAFILNELEVILSGVANNVAIEDLLEDFGHRSGIDDIVSFANVFQICFRMGGNIKDVIRATHEILTDKMEIREEIDTVVTASKTEQNIMVMMPIAIVGMLKMLSPELSANFTTVTGIASTTVAIVLFIVAHYVGKMVLNIKV
ncbi:MAG: hypothetical protein FWE59_00795 [Oscillospiraceae bacterium]|nr:hypothetical protein [Oscillospiraceae bacterium]